MIDVGKVQGSKQMAVPVYVGKTLVYVHSDIEEVNAQVADDEEPYTIWQYNEIQYTKDEYLKLMIDNQFKQAANIDYLAMMADIELPEEV